MKPHEITAHLKQHGWTASSGLLQSSDGTKKVRIWRRPTEGPASANDTVLTLEVSGEVQVFRASIRPLTMVLAGKAPPA